MGVGPRYSNGRSYHVNDPPAKEPKKLPNPDPYNFRVLMEKQVGDYLVAMIFYPDATNFEGVKTVLLKSTSTLKGKSCFDPHFIEGGHLIARFLPNEDGWTLAIEVAQKFLTKSKSNLRGDIL